MENSSAWARATKEGEEPIRESRATLPCGCARYGEEPGITADEYCDNHKDFQEAVNATLASMKPGMTFALWVAEQSRLATGAKKAEMADWIRHAGHRAGRVARGEPDRGCSQSDPCAKRGGSGKGRNPE